MYILLSVAIALLALILYMVNVISDKIITIYVDTRILWERQTNFLAYYCSHEYAKGNYAAMESIFPEMTKSENERK